MEEVPGPDALEKLEDDYPDALEFVPSLDRPEA
jgi:hypothetical protein